MGRDRLRRGYSLEVIFEEESDFCSQLDSLDSVPFQYTTSDTNNNHRTQKGFSVIELLGSVSSKDQGGISADNWDFGEDSIDASERKQHQQTLGKRTTGLLQFGYTLRPPGKQLENTTMNSCFESHMDWDVPSTFHDCHPHQRVFRDVRELSPSSESQNSSSGRCSRVSRRQIVEANWLAMDEEQEEDVFEEEEQILDVDIKVTPSRLLPPRPSLVACPIQYYSTVPPTLIIDTTTSQNNSLQELSFDPIPNQLTNQRSSSIELEMGFKADPHDEIGSSNKYVFPPLARTEDIIVDMNLISSSSSESRSTSASSSSTDVKRVREIFESGKGGGGVGSSSEDDENSNRVLRQPQRFNKRNNPISSSNTIKSKLEKKISAGGGGSSNGTGSDNSVKIPLRSAYSQLSLNQMERYDYVDLLANDNIIIEDSPDLFQTIRNERNRSESSKDLWGSRSNLLFKVDSSSDFSSATLRRSKSVGTGIHNLESEMSESRKSDEGLDKSRPSIIAEELPARNTVKNVRSVFEQILRKNGHPPNVTHPAELRSTLGNPNGQVHDDGKISLKNKANLLSIKSNPTSKIFRSESLRNETGEYGTSVVLKCNPVQGNKKLSKNPRNDDGKSKEEEHIPPCPGILENRPEDDATSTGTSDPGDENDEPKLISPDVLHRIRSLGTTTTYYGGEIVSKTVKNHKCAIGPRRNQTPDSCDEVDFGNFPPSSPKSHPQFSTADFVLSSKPGNKASPDRRRPYHLHLTSFYDDQHQRHPNNSPPRIISVLPKSPSNSPTKSNSPVRSFLEGRNSPEGCESSNTDHEANSAERWINTVDESQSQFHDFLHGENESRGKGTLLLKTTTTTGGSNRGKQESKKFSDAAEGVWF